MPTKAAAGLGVSSRRYKPYPSGAASPSAIVVGAGIVGLCVAWHLAKRGVQVTVVEPNAPGSGCSSGNAGALSPGSVIPLATLRTLRSVPSMLLNPAGALHIPPGYWLRAAPWLLRFVRAARPSRVAEISNALASLYKPAIERHKDILSEAGHPDLLSVSGHLHVYRNEAQYRKDAPDWLARSRHGVSLRKLGGGEVREIEPGISEAYKIGVFLPEQGMSVNPFRQATVIAEELARRQVRFVQDEAIEFLTEGQRVIGVRTATSSITADHVVVAAGIGSARLMKQLGYDVPLESQRGYHIDLPASGVSPGRPVIPADRKVFISPLETGLRVAGTVEFLGTEAPPTEKRAALLLDDLMSVFPQARTEQRSTFWMGHRPCLPDSLPVIGPTRKWQGLWTAFGHGHLGLTGAAVTGDLLSALMAGERTSIDAQPFSIDRFTSG